MAGVKLIARLDSRHKQQGFSVEFARLLRGNRRCFSVPFLVLSVYFNNKESSRKLKKGCKALRGAGLSGI